MGLANHLNRGRIRASYFDVTIAAARLETVAKSEEDMTIEARTAIGALSLRLRDDAALILQMLGMKEQAEIAKVKPK